MSFASFTTFQFTCIWIFMPALTGFVLYHRDVAIFKARFPLIMAFANLMVAGNLTHVYFVTRGGYPCLSFLVFTLISKLSIMYVYIYRAIRLIFNLEISKDIIAYQTGKIDQLGWFTEHRNIMKRRYWIGGAAVMLTILVAIILKEWRNPELDTSCGPNVTANTPALTKYYTGSNYVIILTFAFLAVLSYRLYSLDQDGFGIKFELKWTFIAMVIQAIPVTFGRSLGDVVFTALGGCVYWTLFLFSTVYPIAIYLKTQSQNKEVKVLSLKKILAHPEGFEIFCQFAKKEFSSENPLFWRAVEQYKALPRDQAYEFAKKIAADFIELGAPCMVNLPFVILRNTLRGIENANPVEPPMDLFEVAQTEIFNLMEQDCFQRFLRGSIAEKLKDGPFSETSKNDSKHCAPTQGSMVQMQTSPSAPNSKGGSDANLSDLFKDKSDYNLNQTSRAELVHLNDHLEVYVE